MEEGKAMCVNHPEKPAGYWSYDKKCGYCAPCKIKAKGEKTIAYKLFLSEMSSKQTKNCDKHGFPDPCPTCFL